MMVIDKVSQESVKLLEELKQHEIRFAHWKGNSHLLESLEGKTDIEILVLPEDRLAFEAILLKLGYKKLKSQAWNTYPQVEDWLGFDPETGNLLHLHTHYALVIAGSYGRHITLPWLKFFFEHLQTDEKTGWPIPKPELEAIILLIRIWAKIIEKPYKEAGILYSKQAELIQLLKRATVEGLSNISSSLGLKAPDDLSVRISNILKDGSLAEIRSLSEYFFDQLPEHLKKKQLSTSLKSLYCRYYLKASKVYSRFTGPVKLKKTVIGGGKVIALVGSDGSGKSTLSKDLTNWLTFKIDTHYFYMGKRPFIKSYGKELYSKADVFSSGNSLSKFLKKSIGDSYYLLMIKQKTDMLHLAKKLSRQGSIIICDRFPQKDIYGINDGPKLQKGKRTWFSQREMRLYDKVTSTGADVVFRLQVPPEVAHNRKPEHNFAVIKRKCENINKLTFPNSVVIDVDASKPYNEVLLSIKKEIWKSL